jgi:hypothetical protein
MMIYPSACLKHLLDVCTGDPGNPENGNTTAVAVMSPGLNQQRMINRSCKEEFEWR